MTEKIEINEAQNDSSIELSVGDELVITLDGNPTTGYQWEMEPINNNVVELQNLPEYKSGNSLVGSGGQYKFTLKAVKTGSSTVALKYYRSFEADVPPIQTYSIDIMVK
jgi:inhibitor of cysteine peptidase